jgi:hypothetical protein
MQDTSPEIEARRIEMIRQVSPERRLAMGCSMFDFARQLAREAIRAGNPGISERALRLELFLRFYGDDFSPASRKKIMKALEAVKE